MSRAKPDRKPMIALVHAPTGRSRRTWSGAPTRGGAPTSSRRTTRSSRILGAEGDRAADLAARAGHHPAVDG